MSVWTRIRPGDEVRVKSKRTAGPPFVVTIDELLEPNLADGRGFLGRDGQIYRYWYFDIVVIESAE